MAEALIITALVLLVLAGLGVFVTVKATRAVRRGVERTGRQVRQTVEETGLRARSMQAGPVGEVARVRLELRTSIDSTRRVLEDGAPHDVSLQEARELLDRLHDHARGVDGELQLLMEKEPDRARIAERLPQAREQVARIRESADALRFAAQDRAGRSRGEGFDELEERIRIESGALRHWEGVEPARGNPAPGSEPQPVDPRTADPRAVASGEPGAGEAHEVPWAGSSDRLRKNRPHGA